MNNLSKISVPNRTEVDEKSQQIFDQLKGQLGMVPNLYAAIGYSSNALSSFLSFSGTAGKGTFNNKEVEAIKLAVSEANNCKYCKSAHTAMAKANGFTQEETVQLRKATIADPKLKTLTTIASQIAEKAGHIDNDTRALFFAQGYDNKALIDLISVIISVTFTNYVYGVTQVDVDFPVVD